MPKFDAKIYERDVYQDAAYSAWLKNSNERDVLEQVLRDRSAWWCRDGLSILDIGCGTGATALRVFKILDEKGFSYTYTGVEPYEEQLTRFRADFPDPQNIELVRSKIEDYVSAQKHDFTVMAHALYYVDSFEDIIKKVCATADKIFVVHHGVFGINEVHQQFRDYVKPGPHIISTWVDVQKSLDALGLKYEMEVRDTEVQVAACQDSKNEEGRRLIKFFLERSEPSESQIEEVSAWFRTRPKAMKQDVGYFFIEGWK